MRPYQVAIGLTAMTLNVVGIVYFVLWLSGTPLLFPGPEGPPDYIITALWTTVLGVIGTIAWLRLYRKLTFAPPATRVVGIRRFMIFQRVGLVLLLIPAVLIAAIAAS